VGHEILRRSTMTCGRSSPASSSAKDKFNQLRSKFQYIAMCNPESRPLHFCQSSGVSARRGFLVTAWCCRRLGSPGDPPCADGRYLQRTSSSKQTAKASPDHKHGSSWVMRPI